MRQIGLVFCFLVAAPSASALGQELPREIGAELALGANLTGDTCVLRRVQPGGWGERAARYALHCEGWSQPSGSLVVYLNR